MTVYVTPDYQQRQDLLLQVGLHACECGCVVRTDADEEFFFERPCEKADHLMSFYEHNEARQEQKIRTHILAQILPWYSHLLNKSVWKYPPIKEDWDE